MAKRIKCPSLFCKSTEFEVLTESKKYDIGKGVVGAAVGGFIFAPAAIVGAAAGFNGKKKVKVMCKKCGRVFEVKL